MSEIVVSSKYKKSLLPYDSTTLSKFKLPKSTFRFLTEIGLPRKEDYYFYPDDKYPEGKIRFLEGNSFSRVVLDGIPFLKIATLEYGGDVSINLHTEQVIRVIRQNKIVPINSSIDIFVDFLGAWHDFIPNYQTVVAEQKEINPALTINQLRYLFEPIIKIFQGADPQIMEDDESFWWDYVYPDF